MRVSVAKEQDADTIIGMLKKSFFPLEPLNASIGLVDEEGGCPELEEYCRAVVPSGISLCAWSEESEDAELAGVILNSIILRGQGPSAEDAEVQEGASKFDKILAVNYAVERAADVFALYPEVEEVLDVKILATDPSRGKRGVATTLMEHTIALARSRGLSLVRCVCSGAFSARVAERCGFSALGGIPYDEFLGPDGTPVFRPAPPHDTITVWARTL